MTLTPVPLPIPPSLRGEQPVAGGSSGGMLMPLPVGGQDSRARLQALLRAMSGDLLGRVLLDRWALGCPSQAQAPRQHQACALLPLEHFLNRCCHLHHLHAPAPTHTPPTGTRKTAGPRSCPCR